MFLDQDSKPDTPPTVEPLRINKRDGASPEPRAVSAASQRTNPPRRYSPPPGAGRSNPLPYPDDAPSRTNKSRLPYPDDEPRLSSSRTTNRNSPPPSTLPASLPRVPEYPRPPGQSSSSTDVKGSASKPLPGSPDSDVAGQEGLFQKAPRRDATPNSSSVEPKQASQATNYDYKQHFYPPPGGSSTSIPVNNSNLAAPAAVNRFGSVASISTTRAQRGSPPPPETPIVPPDDQPGGGIEARYAAAQRANQQAAQLSNRTTPQQNPPRRPWTPTEQPGTAPPGPPVVYQGPGQVSPPPQSKPINESASSPVGRATGQSALEQDIQRLHVSGSPPPAYSSVPKPASTTTAQGYPDEKRGPGPGPAMTTTSAAVAAGTAGAIAVGAASASSGHESNAQAQGHPAYANDPRPAQSTPAQPVGLNPLGLSQTHLDMTLTTPGPGPASPPPLPEGWIAHIDPNSGQYYYIHLATQSTQWEFPKGPTPLNLNEPTSPTASHFGGGGLQSPGLSTFGSKPLASPGFGPASPGYAESVMTFQTTTPTVAGFSGPPPSSGVDLYKVAPTNGVYFGPYLRYINMDLDHGIWLGSIMLVSDGPQPPTIHIHQSVDLSPNPRQLKANPISKHQRWTFYRYDIDLKMDEQGSAKWTYAITSHLGCTRYEFLVAGHTDTNWRFVATSGNDFDLNVSQTERTRVGGIGFMWKDIMSKHAECGGFHVQLGTGDQIYADRIWREIPLLKQWLSIKGKDNRKNEPWTPSHEEDVTHAYFHYYTSHFDQPFLREAFAQIPYVLQIDDHDM